MGSSSKGLTTTHGQTIPTVHGLIHSHASLIGSKKKSTSSESLPRYVAPKSPHTLLQEDLEGDPWKIMVCCIMLNCTTRRQMESVMWEFFQRWPNPSTFLEADPTVVAELIKRLGFKSRRTERLRRFSQELLELQATIPEFSSQSSGESSADSSPKTSSKSSPWSLPLEASSITATRTGNKTSQCESSSTTSPTGQVVPSGEAMRKLHGIGEYAARAYEIFCLGQAGEEAPEDGPLTKYWCWMTGTPLPRELK